MKSSSFEVFTPKKFDEIDYRDYYWRQSYKNMYARQNKLQCLSLARFSGLSVIFGSFYEPTPLGQAPALQKLYYPEIICHIQTL